VKLAGLDKGLFDAIIHASMPTITSTDNKGRLELSSRASQFAYGLVHIIFSDAHFRVNFFEQFSLLGFRQNDLFAIDWLLYCHSQHLSRMLSTEVPGVASQ